MIRRIALVAATAALALGTAGAQPLPGYECTNRLIVDSFYSTVSSNGQQSRIEYFAQLRNAMARPLTYHLRFNAYDATQRADGLPRTLPAYGSERLLLGVQMLNNPSGEGRLSPEDMRMRSLMRCE